MRKEEIPATLDLFSFDDLGLRNGCRSCGERPSFMVVPENHRSITIPCCSKPDCYEQVCVQAQQMVSEEKSFRAKKRRFKRTLAGRILRIIRYVFWLHDRNERRRMRAQPIAFWEEYDRNRITG